MKHLLLLTALLCLSSSSLRANEDLPGTNPVIVEYAFHQACELSQMDCTDVPLPQVGYWFLNPSSWGMYTPAQPNIVWLDVHLQPGLQDPDQVHVFGLSVLIHEIVHYLDFKVNGSDFATAEAACVSEGMAWATSNRWLTEVMGAPDMARWDWREAYDHCP